MADPRAAAPVQPHGPLVRVADGVHCVEGPWGVLGRRMTALEVAPGELALHSVMRLDEAGLATLDGLGRVGLIVVPNPTHSSEAPWYAERYPAARVVAPRACAAWLARRTRVSGTIEDDWPPALRGALDALVVGGLRLPEAALWHVASRTLVLTDLCFNFAADAFGGLTRGLMRLNDVPGRFGPSRLLRWVATADRRALARSVHEILAWNVERIVVSHGAVVERDGAAALRAAFAYLGQAPAG